LALGRHGWTSLRHWAGQIALAINVFFAFALAVYALAPAQAQDGGRYTQEVRAAADNRWQFHDHDWNRTAP
jgi:hypothetical protein